MIKLEDITPISINEVDLNVRTVNALYNHQAITIGEVLNHSEKEMLTWKNFGRFSLRNIKIGLLTHGIPLEEYLARVLVNNEQIPHAYSGYGSDFNQKLGKQIFEELMTQTPFENAIRTYWAFNDKSVSFMDCYRVFERDVPEQNFRSRFELLEHYQKSGINPNITQRMIKKALKCEIIKAPPKYMKRLNKEKCDNMYLLIRDGLTLGQIAEELGIGTSAVWAYIKKRNLLRSYKAVQRENNF